MQYLYADFMSIHSVFAKIMALIVELLGVASAAEMVNVSNVITSSVLTFSLTQNP